MEQTFFGTVLWAKRGSSCVSSAIWLEDQVLYLQLTATIISTAIWSQSMTLLLTPKVTVVEYNYQAQRLLLPPAVMNASRSGQLAIFKPMLIGQFYKTLPSVKLQVLIHALCWPLTVLRFRTVLQRRLHHWAIGLRPHLNSDALISKTFSLPHSVKLILPTISGHL